MKVGGHVTSAEVPGQQMLNYFAVAYPDLNLCWNK